MMGNIIWLPKRSGEVNEYQMRAAMHLQLPSSAPTRRVAFAAAHVVIDPLQSGDPVLGSVIDWEQTLSYRRYLWSLGFAVAEAMDTAQRGMGIGWCHAKELIRLSTAEAKGVGGRVACGAGTDQLSPTNPVTLDDVEAAYLEQCDWIEGCGGQVILMASRALARCARGPDDYVRVYRKVLSAVQRPVILHWLGEMFDPSLQGYWGSCDVQQAMDTCLQVIHEHRAKVDGVKISLLDASREVQMRRQLPQGVRMYTGDDFNYPELIRGDGEGHSDALLGIFDAIAPLAAVALHHLDEGDGERFETVLAPTVPLSRHIFQAPTYAYKTGVVFMAYLNGHQNHFRMVSGAESQRSILHLSELFRLADSAGLWRDPDLAQHRMALVLELAGVHQGER